MQEGHYLIVYDIRDGKRLRKVEKCLESYAWRVQKSVFETTATEAVIAQAKARLKEIIKDEDFVLFFKICERDWQKQEKYGKNKKNGQEADAPYIIL